MDSVNSTPISVIFIRNNEYNSAIIEKYKLSKDIIYNIIIYQSAGRALSNKINPRFLVSIGDTFYKMGRLNDALTALKYANNRMPENMLVRDKIAQIETEIKNKKTIVNTKGKNKRYETVICISSDVYNSEVAFLPCTTKQQKMPA